MLRDRHILPNFLQSTDFIINVDFYNEMTMRLTGSTEKSPVIDTNGDEEMTEEEWTRRVAELNKHQVS